MAKKNAAVPILLGVGVLGAGAAAIFATRKKPTGEPIRVKPSRPARPGVPTVPVPARPKPKAKPRPKTVPAKEKPPRGTRNATIGAPYQPGRANEKRNAAIACNRNPKTHPNGKRRGDRPQDVWLTDVAYWETYDQGPLLIDPERASHKEFARGWARIFAHMKECLAKKRAADKAKKKPKAPAAKPVPPPPKPAAPAGPKIPDLAAEKRNADYAVRHEPTTSRKPSPYNRQRGTTEKSKLTWLANWAYWETYPSGPVRITKEPKDRVFALAWLRIRDLVNDGWSRKKRAALPPPPPPPRPAPPPKRREPAPAPVAPPPPKLSTSKSDLSAAAERRNAALVVTERPTTYARLSKRYGGGGYKLEYWLTNVAYWSTYPEGPTKLSTTDATHKPYIAAWARILKYVKGMLALHKKLPKKNPLGVESPEADRNWIAWALAMWASSDLRTASLLADTYQKATRYLASEDGGRRVLERDVGTQAGPLTVTNSGLTAAAAIRVPSGELTAVTNWRNNPSRAFWTATTIY